MVLWLREARGPGRRGSRVVGIATVAGGAARATRDVSSLLLSLLRTRLGGTERENEQPFFFFSRPDLTAMLRAYPRTAPPLGVCVVVVAFPMPIQITVIIIVPKQQTNPPTFPPSSDYDDDDESYLLTFEC